MLRYAELRYAVSRLATLCYATLCYATPRYAMLLRQTTANDTYFTLKKVWRDVCRQVPRVENNKKGVESRIERDPNANPNAKSDEFPRCGKMGYFPQFSTVPTITSLHHTTTCQSPHRMI